MSRGRRNRNRTGERPENTPAAQGSPAGQGGSLTAAAAEAVQAVSQAVVSTGIRGMQVMAELGRAAAEGAIQGGKQAGGAAGQAVADTARAAADTAGRLGTASARTASEAARTVSDTVRESADAAGSQARPAPVAPPQDPHRPGQGSGQVA